MKSLKALIALSLIFAIGGCGLWAIPEDIGTKGSRSVGEYYALEVTMKDTKTSLNTICNSVIPGSKKDYNCREARGIFNISIDAMVLNGYYKKAVLYPENKVAYMEEAVLGIIRVSPRLKSQSSIIGIVSDLRELTALDDTDPSIKLLETIRIVNTGLIPKIAVILEPYIVGED